MISARYMGQCFASAYPVPGGATVVIDQVHVECFKFDFDIAFIAVDRHQQGLAVTDVALAGYAIYQFEIFHRHAEARRQFVESLALPGLIRLPADQGFVIALQVGAERLHLVYRQQDQIGVFLQDHRTVVRRIERYEFFFRDVGQLRGQFPVIEECAVRVAPPAITRTLGLRARMASATSSSRSGPTATTISSKVREASPAAIDHMTTGCPPRSAVTLSDRARCEVPAARIARAARGAGAAAVSG